MSQLIQKTRILHSGRTHLTIIAILALVALLTGGFVGWRAWAQSGRTFVVNSLADFPDADAGDNISGSDGVCATTSANGSVCTLRAAIQEANESASADSIIFDAGVFAAPRRTIALRGSLPFISEPLSITAPAAGVVVDGNRRSLGSVFTTGSGGIITLTGLTITGGTAVVDGGAITNFGTLLVDRCTLIGNAGHEGGAIQSDTEGFGSLTVRNCTITGNSADVVGGGIFTAGSTLIESSTIAGNFAPEGRGGGIASRGNSPATLTRVRNSIVAGNLLSDVDIDPDPASGANANTFSSLGHNLIGSGEATGAFNAAGDQRNVTDPRLDFPGDNGGPTQTRALLPGSPAIDKGRAFGLTTDQRGPGFRRTFDDPNTPNGPSSDGTDIGAFEAQPLPKINTRLELFASPNPAVVGENVIFEARVTPNSGVFPTGTVTFKIGGVVVATRQLSANSRTVTYETSFTSTGARAVTAEYSGDSGFNGSSATITHRVETATLSELVVDTSADSSTAKACSSTPNDCSLRGAITRSNEVPGRQTIRFAIPVAGVQTIAPTSPLPAISGPVSIEGYSQSGATPNTNATGAINATPLIELDGTNAGTGAGAVGLRFASGSSGSVVRGLAVGGFTFGIVLESGRNTVAGCFVGTRANGTMARPNRENGLRIDNSANNTIGGTAPADRNLISGNSVHDLDIVRAGASGNVVAGNLIGTDKSAVRALSNTVNADGILIADAPGNTIGGTSAATRNLIAGHGTAQTTLGGQGVAIAGATSFASSGANTARGNIVRGNTIGTLALPNAIDGILVANAIDTQIGGALAGAGNAIAGNGDDGVQIAGTSSGTVVAGNLIGTRDGATPEGNGDDGVAIQDSASGNTIGGTTVGERNVIVAQGDNGVSIVGPNVRSNAVVGNYIGLNSAGTSALGNVGNGVIVQDAPGNTIGGADASARNVIAGNQSAGVAIVGRTATGNRVESNYLGVNASGLALAARSPDVGVFISDASNNGVGGAPTGTGNLIANHAGPGVVVAGANASGNAIRNNTIGANANGAAAPNGGGVVFREGAHDNTLGGSATTGNRIVFNAGPGVSVLNDTTDRNRISLNSLRANTGLGIDLGGNGTTANDAGDADTGPNQGQNAPVIQSVTGTQITARLSSAPNTTYRIEFFTTDARDTNNDVEGQTFLGTRDATTNASGVADVTLIPLNGVPPSRFITATAIDPGGNTSEFSPAVQAPAAAPPTEVNSLADSGPGSLREVILHSNTTPGRQTITFNFPVPGARISTRQVQTITPATPLPTITDPVTINGFSQPGSSANTLEVGSNAVVTVQINGGGANFDGLTVDSGEVGTLGTVVRGLQISNFKGAGLRLRSAFNVVAGCVITGNGEGVFVDGGRDNSIGKAANFVGSSGEPSSNTPGDRNLISGNTGAGIRIAPRPSFPATNNAVFGCYIGTNAQGTGAQPNGGGIVVSSTGNDIGFRFAREGNLISGNAGDGILLAGDAGTTSSFNNTISGNFIGTAANGTDALPNAGDGLKIGQAGAGGASSRNFVGGSQANADNLIENNGGDGVRVVNGTRNTLRRNRIFANAHLGINLVGGVGEDPNGVTPNDASDADTGPNELQNFPIVTSATSQNGTTRIQGTFQSAPGSYTLEFFRNNSADPSGVNEGAFFLASESVTVPASGTLSFDVTRSTNLPSGSVVTATATDANGNTSEFSNAVQRAALIATTTTLTSSANPSSAGQAVTFTATVSESGAGTPTGTVTFREGNTTLGIGTLDASGKATFTTSTLSIGTHNITAGYGGSTGFSGSTSRAVAQVVNQAACSTVVTTTADSGAGSLREAINCANATAGAQTISFNIPGAGVRTITVTTALPVITDPVTIDGATQPGFNTTTRQPVIELTCNPSPVGDGLSITSGDTIVRSLTINRFVEGIRLTSRGNNTIQGCYLGTDATGTQARPNTADGILVNGSSNNLIGGATAAARNLLSGNRESGVDISNSLGTATNNT
ncbi:MAG: Ig-like domain-containing protein, partial [Armatimonadota bacterium]|nr:Ig-like domain-containing protein [Armatimonadota bacterium]